MAYSDSDFNLEFARRMEHSVADTFELLLASLNDYINAIENNVSPYNGETYVITCYIMLYIFMHQQVNT